MKRIYERPQTGVYKQLQTTGMLMVSIGVWDDTEHPDSPTWGE